MTMPPVRKGTQLRCQSPLYKHPTHWASSNKYLFGVVSEPRRPDGTILVTFQFPAEMQGCWRDEELVVKPDDFGPDFIVKRAHFRSAPGNGNRWGAILHGRHGDRIVNKGGNLILMPPRISKPTSLEALLLAIDEATTNGDAEEMERLANLAQAELKRLQQHADRLQAVAKRRAI